MLRITVQESGEAIELKLEGRVAGPWVDELRHTWSETSPRRQQKKLSLDLRNVTYSDPRGLDVLREIYAQTGAEVIAGSPWTQYLAEQIKL